MNNERWEALVQQAKKNFKDVSLENADLNVETADGLVNQGTEDILTFTNENGRFMIVRENKPQVLDKKMHFSHRQGDSARTEYTFSDTELSHKIRMYMEDDMGEWQELETENINNAF
jgi:hypothetical protein